MESLKVEMGAKYPGVCFGCGDEIEPGMLIVWFGGGEAYHKGCEPQDRQVQTINEVDIDDLLS